IDAADPGWPLVQEWITTARNSVTVLEVDREQAAQTLFHLQITTHSVLGSVAWETGGILVDHSWLRILGSGNPRLTGSLFTWNLLSGTEALTGALIVAHDAVGGFFALNGGTLIGSPGSVNYFAADTLAWEDLGTSSSQFVQWTMHGDIQGFYAN